MVLTPASTSPALPEDEKAAEIAARVASGPGFWTGWLAELGREGLLETLMAQHLGLELAEKRLLAVMREPCDPPLRMRIAIWLDMTDDTTFSTDIARLCAATDASLHLVEPLGFSIQDDDLRRAGLDYWDQVNLWVHPDWRDFREAVARERCLYFSAHGERSYFQGPYAQNSVLVFGKL